MCFTIPRKITSIDQQTATLETGERIDIGALEDCRAGDFVMVTAGIAVAKLTPEEGSSMRSLIKKTHETIQQGN